MTWESQGPAVPQDPRWSGEQQPAGWRPPPPDYPPAPGGYPAQGPGGYPASPPGGAYPSPPPGYVPPPGYLPPPGGPYPPPPGGPYPPPPGYLPPEPVWQPPPAYPLAPDAFPVNVSYDREARINRLWGIPLIGMLVRSIVLIPHFFVLTMLGILVAFLLAFTWVAVLFLGRQADLIYTIVGGYNRWLFRVLAYGLLMVDRYPPFSLGEDDPRL